MKVYVLMVYHSDGWDRTDWLHGVYSKEPKAKRAGDWFLKANPDSDYDFYGYNIEERELDE